MSKLKTMESMTNQQIYFSNNNIYMFIGDLAEYS